MEINHIKRLTNETKQKICTYYLELSKEIPLNKIRVNDLTKLAGINRQTFYYHYASLDDLVVQLCEVYIQEAIDETTIDRKWMNHLTSILKAFQSDEEFIMRVYNELGLVTFSYVTIQLVRMLMEISLAQEAKISKEEFAYISGFYGSGIANIFMQWLSNNMQEDPDLIGATLALLIEHGYTISASGLPTATNEKEL